MSRYSLNHYFVDTSYRAFYEPHYQNDPPFVNPDARIIEAEVWVEKLGTSSDTSDRLARAWINLPPRPATGYVSSYLTGGDTAGRVEFAKFYRLEPSSYRLEADGYLGVVSFDFLNVPDVVFAIAYRRADGRQCGDFLRNGFEATTTSPMVLKMVKPRNLFDVGRAYYPAWNMILKNIYSIRPAHISRHEFQLQLFRGYDYKIQGQALLTVLGLDRFDTGGSPKADGDGIFDFLPGRTILPDAGEIVFPSLRPFDNGIRQYFNQRGLPIPDSTYFFSELYDTTRVAAERSSRNKYVVRGKAIFD